MEHEDREQHESGHPLPGEPGDGAEPLDMTGDGPSASASPDAQGDVDLQLDEDAGGNEGGQDNVVVPSPLSEGSELESDAPQALELADDWAAASESEFLDDAAPPAFDAESELDWSALDHAEEADNPEAVQALLAALEGTQHAEGQAHPGEEAGAEEIASGEPEAVTAAAPDHEEGRLDQPVALGDDSTGPEPSDAGEATADEVLAVVDVDDEQNWTAAEACESVLEGYPAEPGPDAQGLTAEAPSWVAPEGQPLDFELAEPQAEPSEGAPHEDNEFVWDQHETQAPLPDEEFLWAHDEPGDGSRTDHSWADSEQDFLPESEWDAPESAPALADLESEPAWSGENGLASAEFGPAETEAPVSTNGHSAHVGAPMASADFASSSLEIRRIEPQTAGDDQPVTYGFIVKNTAPVSLSNVSVEHTLPPGARCIGVSPRPEVFNAGNTFAWHIGEMEAGAERSFLVRVQKSPGTELPSETTAILRACYYLKAAVVRPRLLLTLTGPDTVLRGQPAVFQLVMKNTGTAPLRGLVLSDQPGSGLEHPDGERLEAHLGSLAQGETLQLKLTCTAVQGGRQTYGVTVTTREGLQSSAQADLEVTEPALAVRTTESVRSMVEHAGEYKVEVSNPGTAPIQQALLIDSFPQELRFLGASHDGEYDAADHSVTWILGELQPGETRSYSVQFVATLPGDFAHRCLAWSDCGLEAAAEGRIASEIDLAQSSHILEDLLASIDREDEATARGAAADAPTLAPRHKSFGAGGAQYIVFTMGDAEYAIPIDAVLEYGHPLSVTPVPNVPDWVRGVANLHGDIVSMVDLRLFLGMERLGYGREGRMLVVRSRQEDMVVGLIVDHVKGIRVVEQGNISLPNSPVEDRLAPYLSGVADLHGRLLVLLNIDQLLLSPEMRQFEPV